MTCAVFAFPECAAPAARLARELGIDCHPVAVRRFPDGESLVSVAEATETSLLYRSLDHPNEKIFELLLAASALREGGARRVVLVIPYLAYMRQDIAFSEGEAVSQRVLGQLLSGTCDALVTIDPHLHRIGSLSEVMPRIEAVAVSAAPALAAALRGDDNALLVGPDRESRPWVEAIAGPMQLEVLLGVKRRIGDRHVELDIPGAERAAGRRAVLVDDVISSGTTLQAAARLLRQAGAWSIKALATHCLASEEDLRRLGEAGIGSIRSTDSVQSDCGDIPVAPLLAQEMRRREWCTRKVLDGQA
jgi:ribose-phosphate pyrophosphokinase